MSRRLSRGLRPPGMSARAPAARPEPCRGRGCSRSRPGVRRQSCSRDCASCPRWASASGGVDSGEKPAAWGSLCRDSAACAHFTSGDVLHHHCAALAATTSPVAIEEQRQPRVHRGGCLWRSPRDFRPARTGVGAEPSMLVMGELRPETPAGRAVIGKPVRRRAGKAKTPPGSPDGVSQKPRSRLLSQPASE